MCLNQTRRPTEEKMPVAIDETIPKVVDDRGIGSLKIMELR